MKSIRMAIQDALPLRVEGLDVNDPIFNLYGAGWSLAVSCPWRLVSRGLVLDWHEDRAGLLRLLAGLSIIAVTTKPDPLVDPIFHFSDDAFLALHADTDLDPWVFRVPEAVLVGVQPRPQLQPNACSGSDDPGSTRT